MYKLMRMNVVKLTNDPDKRDRLIADGFELVSEAPAVSAEPEAPAAISSEPEAADNDKPAKGKAAADGKSTGKA